MYSRYSAWTGGLVLGVAVALLPRAQAAEVDRYLPEDAEWVVSINVRQVLDSNLGKKYGRETLEKEIQKNAQAQQTLKQLGLNPVKDIARVVVAGPGGEAAKNDTVAIVRGTFNTEKIQAAAEAFANDHPDRLKIHKQGDVSIYETHDPNAEEKKGAKPAFAVLLNKEVLAISPSRKAIEKVIAKSDSKQETEINKHLAALIGKQDSKQSVWVAAVFSKKVKEEIAKQKPEVQAFVGNIKAVSAWVNVTKEVKIHIGLQTTGAQVATKLREQLEGIKGLAGIAIMGNEQLKDVAPLLTDVLDTFKFTRDESTVDVDFTISGDVIDEAIKKLPKQ